MKRTLVRTTRRRGPRGDGRAGGGRRPGQAAARPAARPHPRRQPADPREDRPRGQALRRQALQLDRPGGLRHLPRRRRRPSPTARSRTSEGIAKAGKKLTGTRNAPTVVNAAYFDAQFWDGRSPSLEDQSQHPFVNPVEMGLKDHQPILKIVRTDPEYVKAFEQVFGKKGAAGHHEGGQAGDRRLRAHQGVRQLALRPLLLRRRGEGAHRRAEARLRPLRQQGPLRLLPRDRADAGPLHRQPLPQRRRRASTTSRRTCPSWPASSSRPRRPSPRWTSRSSATSGPRSWAASPSPAASRAWAPSRRRPCATWPSPRPTCTTAA